MTTYPTGDFVSILLGSRIFDSYPVREIIDELLRGASGPAVMAGCPLQGFFMHRRLRSRQVGLAGQMIHDGKITRLVRRQEGVAGQARI